MSFLDALFGNAPQIQMGTQAQVAPMGPQLGFAQAYQQGIGGDAAARQRQLAFLQALQQSMAGQGPGAALANMQFQGNLNQAQAMGANQIASNRGLSPATQAFLLAQQQGQAGGAAAASAGATRAQQQLGAQAQLGGALQGMRGQDLQLAGLGAQGNAAQNSLNSANFNAAQGLNAQMGTAQAGMQQTANQQSLMGLASGANGLFGAAGRVFGFAAGGPVDTPAADTVPAMLSPGEVVIPRSIAQGPDAPNRARDFIAALQGYQAPPDAFLQALRANEAQVAQRHGQLQRAFGAGGPVTPVAGTFRDALLGTAALQGARLQQAYENVRTNLAPMLRGIESGAIGEGRDMAAAGLGALGDAYRAGDLGAISPGYQDRMAQAHARAAALRAQSPDAYSYGEQLPGRVMDAAGVLGLGAHIPELPRIGPADMAFARTGGGSAPLPSARGAPEPIARAGTPIDFAQTAYHGSPHDFDVFESGKAKGIGSGIHGVGHYLTRDPRIAEWYRSDLVDRSRRKEGGSIHAVDVPENKNLLQKDISLAKQGKPVRDALKKAGLLEGLDTDKATGSDLYDMLSDRLGSDAAASEALRNAGIPGASYSEMPQSYGMSGKDTRNFVIWDESAMKPMAKGKNISEMQQRETTFDFPGMAAQYGLDWAKMSPESRMGLRQQVMKELSEETAHDAPADQMRVYNSMAAAFDKANRMAMGGVVGVPKQFADGGVVGSPGNLVELPTTSEPPPLAPVDIPIAQASFAPPQEIAPMPAQPAGIDAMAAQQILEAQREAGAQKAAQLAAQQAYAQWAQTGAGPRPDPTGAVPPEGPGLLVSHAPPDAPAATRSVAPTYGGYGGAPPSLSGREQLLQGFERGAETPEARGQREFEQNIEKKGQIQAQGAQAQQEALAQQERQRTQDLAAFQQASKANQAAIEQWSLREPDPNRWWANKSLGNKVATGISMILGGFFSGISGQKNQALQVVEDSIKQDVDAQAQKKDSMLRALQGQGRSLQEAYALTHAAMLESTANRMAQMQASMTQQNVGPDTEMAIQQLRAQAAQLKQAAAIKAIEAQKVMSEIAKNNAEAAKAYSEAGKAQRENRGPAFGRTIDSSELGSVPKEERNRYVHVGGGKWMPAASEEQAKAATGQLESSRNIARSIETLEGYLRKGTLVKGSEDYAGAAAAANAMMGPMRTLLGLGVLSEADKDLVNSMVAHPEEFLTTSATNKGKLRELRRMANQGYANAYDRLGVTIPKTKARD